jgi:hypothetical protein
MGNGAQPICVRLETSRGSYTCSCMHHALVGLSLRHLTVWLYNQNEAVHVLPHFAGQHHQHGWGWHCCWRWWASSSYHLRAGGYMPMVAVMCSSVQSCAALWLVSFMSMLNDCCIGGVWERLTRRLLGVWTSEWLLCVVGDEKRQLQVHCLQSRCAP